VQSKSVSDDKRWHSSCALSGTERRVLSFQYHPSSHNNFPEVSHLHISAIDDADSGAYQKMAELEK